LAGNGGTGRNNSARAREQHVSWRMKRLSKPELVAEATKLGIDTKGMAKLDLATAIANKVEQPSQWL